MERPHVLANMAMTADGKVDTTARRGARISSLADLRRVDELRAEADAIMVGGRTLVAEDPRLVVRSPELRAARIRSGRCAQPARVAVVSTLPDPPSSDDLGISRFLFGEPARVVVLTTERMTPGVRARLRSARAEVVVMGERRVDLVAGLRYLAATGIRRSWPR